MVFGVHAQAGGFIYIALVDIVPDLLNDEVSKHSGLAQTALEVLAMSLGVLMMVIIAAYE